MALARKSLADVRLMSYFPFPMSRSSPPKQKLYEF